MAKEDRLLSQLNTSPTAVKDAALWQVIKQLIKRIRDLEDLIGGGSTTTNITNEIIQQFITGGDIGSGDDGAMGPQGIRGIDGAIGTGGPAGPITVGPMGLNGEDGEDGFPIPGNIGLTGPQGIQGPQGPVTVGPMGMNGEDGEDGFPIPGPVGPNGSTIEDWEGKVICCAGNGDPNLALSTITIFGAAPTPTNITTSQGRVSYFKLRTAITVANIRWYAVGSTTTIYHIAIYKASDDSRVSSDNNPSTVANTWNLIADSFTLNANELYYCVVSADSVGSTAGPVALGNTITSTTGQIRALPTAWPGNLDWDSNYVRSYSFAVVAVTLGVLPNPGNTPTAFSATLTGGMPAIFLDAA